MRSRRQSTQTGPSRIFVPDEPRHPHADERGSWHDQNRQKYGNDPERVLDCFQKIDVSSKLLIDLINEVLDMSKIESGRILLAEEEVNLAELTQGIVTMVQPLLQDKSLQFNTYVCGITHETVISDVQRLQQLIVNLLSNAVKYTPEGGSVSLKSGNPRRRNRYGALRIHRHGYRYRDEA